MTIPPISRRRAEGRSRRPAAVVGTAVAVVALALAGCGGGSGTTSAGSSTSKATTTQLTVLAAASLTNAFTDMAKDYEGQHPDVDLKFSFEGSQEIVTQIQQSSPADVAAMASTKTMGMVKSQVTTPQLFATNRLVIAVQKGNPKHIKTLADLAKPGLKVILADPSVPAGDYAHQVLDKAKVKVTPKSKPTDVRQVLTPIKLGEADAGIVYVTDVRDAGGPKIQSVTIPTAQNLVASYPIASVKASKNGAAAKAWVSYVTGSEGQATLKKHGFGPPASS